MSSNTRGKDQQKRKRRCMTAAEKAARKAKKDRDQSEKTERDRIKKKTEQNAAKRRFASLLGVELNDEVDGLEVQGSPVDDSDETSTVVLDLELQGSPANDSNQRDKTSPVAPEPSNDEDEDPEINDVYDEYLEDESD